MTTPDEDERIGEVFEDQDTRNRGRLIRILEWHPVQHPRVSERPELRAYRAVRVDEFWEPVGRQRVKISAKTLETRYRKISR